MPITTDKDQRRFFREQGYIEFEELISDEQLNHVNDEIKKLTQSLGRNSDRLFRQGHDLFRQSDYLKKICTSKLFAALFAELIGEKSIRLGFDQFIPKNYSTKSLQSLEESCCLRGILGGLIICLNSADASDPSVFPSHAGNGIFFRAQHPIDYQILQQRPQQQFYLIGYTSQKTQYSLQENDPHTHDLKKLGYIFGDSLQNEHHPLIIR